VAREQRKLAAILAADVVGYTRLMGRDESGTLARLRKNRSERFDPVLARYGGRLVKLTGDGALVEFASAVDALSAAIEFQQAMAEANRDQPPADALVFRMGLHLGDLIVDGDDLYGDGVNIAARLEGEAPAGGIVVSRTVHEAVAGRLKATFDELGGLALKNIDRPVQAFGVKWEPLDWQVPPASEAIVTTIAAPQFPLSLPARPSIAVLPFQNMSGDAEQEYFVDGLVEDIITGLSRFKSLFVIARNSTFTYKGKSIDVRVVGRELGVRYVLEGSVRKAGNRLRITGQLVDSVTGGHLWADRFDGSVEDVFEFQDQITAQVIGQLPTRIEVAETERLKAKPTSNLTAYESHLRGMKALHLSTRESMDDSLRHFYRAIELDPEFASPCAWAAIAYSRRRQAQWMADVRRECAEGLRLGRRAAELRDDDSLTVGAAGFALAYFAGDVAAGLAHLDRAIALNRNDAMTWHGSGWVRLYNGDHDVAIEHLDRAERLSPIDPQRDQIWIARALAHFCAGRDEESIAWCEKVLQWRPDSVIALTRYAAGCAMLGRTDEARSAMSRALQLNPGLRHANFGAASIMVRQEDRERLREANLRAGMPE